MQKLIPSKDYGSLDIKTLENVITKIKKSGDEIFLRPEGEEALIKILNIQDFLTQTIKDIKEQLADKASKIDPNFTSITGDKIKVFYKYFGSKYYLDESLIDKVPNVLIHKEVKYKIKTKELEDYIQKTKGIPVGIKAVDRKKAISFVKRKGMTYDE